MFENSSDLVCVIDPEARIAFTSPAARHLLGVEPELLIGRALTDFVDERDRARAVSMLRAALRQHSPSEPIELRIARDDKQVRWVEVVARDLRSEEEIKGLVVTARDITDRRTAEGQLANSEARFRALVQNSSDVVGVLDGEGNFVYLSPSVSTTLGYRPEELISTNAFDLLEEAEPSEVAYSELWATPEFAQRRTEVRVPDRYGRLHTLDLTLTDLRTEPAVGGVVLNARDVSDNRELERSLKHQALHDALTGLPNREAFANSVGEALNRPNASPENLAVMIVDLDDFKTINDSMGHEVGDQVLVVVAERIRNCLRLSDSAARLGADEFAIMIEPVGGEQEATAIAERILDSVSDPVMLGGRTITLSASAGIARRHDGPRSSQILIRNADMAMHTAKLQGKGSHAVFREQMHESVAERMELRAALEGAVERDEFVLYYQPILDMDGETLRGAEALIRWRHPERGILAPGAFIALAEETGLIIPMGAWVLRESIRQLGVWLDRGLVGADFNLDVNLSPLQLRDPSVVDEVANAVALAGVRPDNLTIEITESLLVEDGSGCKERLEQLHALGIGLAVDDFGTGYSSLSYIQKFPIDVIKIDRSFVDGLGSPAKDSTVVRAIIDISRRIGATTVAEGIETEIELDTLRELGCDLGQGFLFSKPVPAPEFAGLITPRGHRGPVFKVPERTPMAEPLG